MPDPSSHHQLNPAGAGRLLRAISDPPDPPSSRAASSVPADDKLPTLPNYTLINVLGQGAGGVVYRAFRSDGSSDRPLALKVLRARFGEDAKSSRGWRELRILESLRLPCVPRLLDYGMAGSSLYIVTELIDGLTPNEYADRHSLRLRERVAMLMSIAEAVQSLHERGVIHRDLKPSNILITSSRVEVTGGDGGVQEPAVLSESVHWGKIGPSHGQPVLLDLGLSRLDAGGPVETLTEEGSPIGTPAFMSPEQARGERDAITIRTDVYSLGAIGYLLIAGHTPHDLSSISIHEAVRRVAQDNGRRVQSIDPSIPNALAMVIERAATSNPHNRYASAAEFADDLGRWLDGRKVLAAPPGRVARSMVWIRGHPVWCALGMACLLALVMYWCVWRPTPPRLVSATIFGGAGSQRGTGISIGSGGVYVAGVTTNALGDDGLLAWFTLPPGQHPIWRGVWPSVDGQDEFNGVVATSTGVYAVGASKSQTNDARQSVIKKDEGKEVKGVLVSFPLTDPRIDGIAVGAEKYTQVPLDPTVFEYAGTEELSGITARIEDEKTYLYVVGFAQTGTGNGGRLQVSKVSPDLKVLWTRSDTTMQVGEATTAGRAVVSTRAGICIAGMNAESGITHACLWAYSPEGELLWMRQSPAEPSRYWAVASLDEHIVAVGSVSGGGPDDCLIENWDADGTLIWSRQIDLGGAEDVLRGVALADGMIYAVGYTRGNTKGGADGIILEVDDSEARLVTTTRFGDMNEDIASAVAILGKDLYVVGESRSFDGENDMVWGQNMPGENNEVILLRYILSPGGGGLRWR